ncbi:hypothetical protein [Methylobacterium sp. WL8]|uniref:hypothetical protein n=1 Tax=Methylobacterium sp. WL8 TaxID=2603899 RepID=UPI0011C8D8B8|nr:hypothetical protein [Methylobacterium sp. WL8]TXN76685.1 hypothetical protein FV234_24460 [Methylobacterium sp. WL8]
MLDQLPLSDRVAAVLTAATTSGAVSALISEAAAEAGRLKVALDAAEATSLDPLVPGAEAASAADRFVRLDLDIRRQQAALQALDRRLVEVTRAEEAAVERVRLAAAKKLQDAAVTALREDYPRLAGELAALMRQVAAADEAIGSKGAVEHLARGVPPNGATTWGVVSALSAALFLPAFDAQEAAYLRPIWNGRAQG